MDNKFEDTRNSIQNLINIFYKKDIRSKQRNLDFEQDVIQIIHRKSIHNFELFAYAFDIIYERNFKNVEDFREYIISQKKNKKNKRVVELFFQAENLEERDKTIKLAFKIYDYHLKLTSSYYKMYTNANKEFQNVNNKVFDEEFFLKDYEFTNLSFDIFLSHRYYLRFYNIIVFYILTVFYDLLVYVDWIFDFDVDRKKLSKDTVKLLKYRMNQSKKLVFFNIMNSITTNWMAWEVGYFSCMKEDNIAILDLDGYCTGNKNVEVLSSNDIILYNNEIGLHLKSNKTSITSWVKT